MIRSLLVAAVVFSGTVSRSLGDDSGTQIFDATIHAIKSLHEYRGTAKVVSGDPRFVATLELGRDVDGLGKKGERVDVAIHSPARDFRMGDFKSYKYPLRYRFSLSKFPQSGRLFLLGSLPTNAQQDGTGQPATRLQSKSEGGDKPQPESEGRSR